MGNILSISYRDKIIEMLEQLIINCGKCDGCEDISNTAFYLQSKIEEYSQIK